jgi:uncharacterized protein (DUF1499 family)
MDKMQKELRLLVEVQNHVLRFLDEKEALINENKRLLIVFNAAKLVHRDWNSLEKRMELDKALLEFSDN